MKCGLRSGGFWLMGCVLLGAALYTSPASAACLQAPSGLVGWWAGDGSVLDFAGTNNGVLQSGATVSGVGQVGNAFTFDGASSYVQIADSPALKQTNLTVEAWVKFTSLTSTVSVAPAGEQYIVFKQNTRNGNFEGYYLGKTRISGTDHFTFQVSSAAGATVELDSTTAIAAGVWYHVAAVRGSNYVQLFVNGVMEVQASVSFAQDYGTLPLYFGTSGQTFWDGKLNGVLDEVSLYNRALSATEISNVFAANAAGKCKGATIVTQPLSQTVSVGSNVLFSTSATGYGTLRYQWRFNGVNVTGATNSSYTVANTQVTNAGSYVVVVTNTLGAATSSVAVLTVLIPPSISAQPQSRTNECGSSASFAVTAGGTAPLGYQWYFNGGAISGATASSLSLPNVSASQQGNYVVVITNSAGSLTSSPAAVLTVVDTTPPVVTMLGINPITVECHATFVDPGATAGDTCAGALPVLTNSTVNANAVGSYTIRYIATDSGGNSTTNTRTVNVIDTTAPTVTLNGANPMTNECHAAFTDPGAIASDICAGGLGVGATSTVNPNAVGVYTIKYVAADPSGNSTTNTRTVYIVDTTAPVITLNGANPLTNECHVAFTDPGATANDGCAGSLSVSGSGTVNANAVGTYILSYTAIDPSGNSVTNTRTVVVVDKTAPVITLNGANPLTNECHVAFTDPGATANDSCAGTLAIATNSTVNPNAAGTYTIKYVAVDPSGNSVTNSRTVVIVDTAPPIITLNGANPLTNECHAAFADPGATANDSCAGSVGVNASSTVNPDAVGTYSIKYVATDPAGNSVTNTRTVVVVDKTAPVITLNGANPLTNECHVTFTDPGATANDSCAGSLGVNANSTVNANAAGTYSITYTAIDPAGNSVTNTRTVVIVDTTAPVITITGANPFTNECHVAFSDPGATASDSCAGSLGVNANSTVNANAVGTYAVTYTAVDPSGNSVTNTRTVVVVDRIAPVITINGANPFTNECHVAFNDPGATANDSCAGALSVNASSTVNANAVGTYSVVYTTTDPSGNAVTNTRTVVVVDRTAPVITITGANPLTNECHTAFADPGATANDLCAGPLGVNSSSTVNPDAAGVYAITYTVTDPNGNSATNTRVVYIVDTTKPQITSLITNLTLTVNANCQGVLPNLTTSDFITAADSCSSVTVTQFPLAGTIYSLGTTNQVALTAVDTSGNTSNRFVSVIVPGAPSIITQPTNFTMLASNSTTMSVAACGIGQLRYQWRHANTNLPGATNALLALNTVRTNDGGNYVVVITNTAGAITSQVAVLTVLPYGIITDPNLNAIVMGMLGKTTCDVSALDLVNITNIYAPNANITNLTGLSAATNLATLYLGGNAIVDLTPLQGLTSLTTLFIQNNSVTNLAPLAGLTNLSYLDVRYNPVASYESVVGAMTGLTDLYLGGDSVTNLSFAQNLTALKFLSLDHTAVLDASPLAGLPNLAGVDFGYGNLTNVTQVALLTNLDTLYLSGNSLTNVAFVTNLTKLTSLVLCSNKLTAVPPVAALPSLNSLHLGGNRTMANYAGLTALVNVTNLWVSGNAISNLAPLQTLTWLGSLNLDDNAIRDPSPLAGLTRLTTLSAERNLITNCATLLNLTNLSSLWLGGNFIGNVNFMVKMTRVTAAELDGNLISDISPLGSLKQLNYLSLKKNLLTDGTFLSLLTDLIDLRLGSQGALNDLSFLPALTRLSYLDLDGNQISDLSPLSGLTNLKFLDLNTNRITSVSALIGLTNLATLSLQQNRLTDISPLVALSALASVDVRMNLLDLSTGSAARSTMQTLINRCPPVSILPAQPDTAPTQRTAPVITVLTPLATLINGTWPIAASATSILSFSVLDNGPTNAALNIGAQSSNNSLIPNAGLVPTAAGNQMWNLSVTPSAIMSNTATITISATNEVGLSTIVSVLVTVVTPQTVSVPDPHLNAAVRTNLNKPSGNLTTLDMLSVIDLSASALQITNLTGLEFAGNLSTLDLIQNSVADIRSITNLPRLIYVNLVWNRLDLSTTNTPAFTAIRGLTNRNVVVLYLPQRQAPVITANSVWTKGPGHTSSFFFTVTDTVASSAQLKVGATSSNTGLIPNANIGVARYIYEPYWTLTATPITGLTGSTVITLTATNDVGLYSSFPVTVNVVAPVPLAGGPLNGWTSLPWLTSANAPWYVQSTYMHGGLPTAQSGAAGDGEESWLQTTVNGPGTLTFWQKVSSEAAFDFLDFYVNDVMQTNFTISGEVDWQQRTLAIPAGTQTLRWEYNKDNSGKTGVDAGWLSEVSFVGSGLRLELAGPPSNGTSVLILRGDVGNRYQIDASSNLLNWGSIVILTNTATNTGGVMSYTDTAPVGSLRRYYRAKQVP